MKQSKSIIFVFLMMIAVLVVGTAAVDAQSSASLPAYTITSVTSGVEVTVQTKDFPADAEFVVQMRDIENAGEIFNVAKFNSGSGGAFNLALPIPESVKNAKNIEMTILSVSDPSGLSISAYFANSGTGGKVSCDYTVVPSFGFDVVVKNGSITVTTKDFAPNSTYKVKMGVMTSGTVTRYGIKGFATYELPQPYYDFTLSGLATHPYVIPDLSAYGYNFPDPVVPPCWPTGQDCAYTAITTSGKGTIFSGIEVGEYESLDGSPRTVSYNIPSELKDVSPIVVRFEDQGPCGFYSFNYFWNADFPVSGAVPTVEIVPIP